MRGKRLLAMIMAGVIAFSPTIVSAAVKNGWFRNKTIYYVNGVKATGLKKISGKYYFFNTKGKIVKAKWKKVKGKKYYFNKSTGAAVTGVRKINGKYYLFRKNGTLTGTGLVTYAGKKYLVKKGVVQIGLIKYKGYQYYGTKKGLKKLSETEKETVSMDYAWSESSIVWNKSNAVSGELVDAGNGRYRFKLTDGNYYVGTL